MCGAHAEPDRLGGLGCTNLEVLRGVGHSPRMPASLAAAQVAFDRRLLRRQPNLLERKWTRMAASPFAFLRGASALWAQVLTASPAYLSGLPGAGVVVGDLHLENFGTFHAATGMTFHVNDFDETFEGPWAHDVLRLLTSVLLARAELGVSGTQVLSLARAMLEGHAAGLAGARRQVPQFVAGLVDQGARVPDERLLEKRLQGDKALRRDPARTSPAPAPVVKQVPAAVLQWAQALTPAVPEYLDLRVVDVVRRIAGTGSLGVERLWVLCRMKKLPVLLELKEVRGSPSSPGPHSGETLVALMRRALPSPPADFAGACLGKLPVVIHRVHAGEEKMDLARLEPGVTENVLAWLGYLAGSLHRAGATHPARWTATHHRLLVDRASELAGLHAHAFLDFCRLTEGQGR